MSPGLPALGNFIFPGLPALSTRRSQGLPALGTFMSLGLPALGTFMSLGLPALGTFMSRGLPALGSKGLQIIDSSEDCVSVPRQECKIEPVRQCVMTTRRRCQDVPVIDCKQVPERKCKLIQRQVCEAIPQEECQSVAREQCDITQREECFIVPRKRPSCCTHRDKTGEWTADLVPVTASCARGQPLPREHSTLRRDCSTALRPATRPRATGLEWRWRPLNRPGLSGSPDIRSKRPSDTLGCSESCAIATSKCVSRHCRDASSATWLQVGSRTPSRGGPA